MLTTLLPGFENLTRDSQQTFRALLTALSEPGRAQEIVVPMTPPGELNAGCAAACLSLIDFETVVWLQPTQSSEVRDWLRFHTGCQFTEDERQADFAVINDPVDLVIKDFCWGSAETPEASTTLLIQVDFQEGSAAIGSRMQLSGPGILRSRTVTWDLPAIFWQQWQGNYNAYPRGVDCFLFDQRRVLGLPRTVQIAREG